MADYSVTCMTVSCPGREKFLANSEALVRRFTVKPAGRVCVMRDACMADNMADAFEQVTTEYTAIIEDDDWYHERYLEEQMSKLMMSGRSVIGYDPTIYYHIVHDGVMVLPHRNRAAMFTTVGRTAALRDAFRNVYRPGRPGIGLDFDMWD